VLLVHDLDIDGSPGNSLVLVASAQLQQPSDSYFEFNSDSVEKLQTWSCQRTN
jgi:hypothetical protein